MTFLIVLVIITSLGIIAALIAVLVILVKRNKKAKADFALNPKSLAMLNEYSKQILEYKGGKKKLVLNSKNKDEILHFIVFFLVTKLEYDEKQIKDFLDGLMDLESEVFIKTINSGPLKKYLELIKEKDEL